MKNNNARFVTRRGASNSSGYGYGSSSAVWARNHNSVRHEGRKMGPVSNAVLIGMLVLTMGLIYVAQGTKATSYDYELSAVESEIQELSARKDDLTVEKARATSIATAKSSEVAANMEAGSASGYAQ